MPAYVYYWSPITRAVTAAFAKSMAEDAGAPRKIAVASNREEARSKAEAHYRKALAIASASGRIAPERVNMI